jgi:hypothetical protein
MIANCQLSIADCRLQSTKDGALARVNGLTQLQIGNWQLEIGNSSDV